MSEPLDRVLPERSREVSLVDDGSLSLVTGVGRAPFLLNASARAIWELCDGNTTVGELSRALCEVFELDRERAIADVSATLERFRAADLLEPSEASVHTSPSGS